MKTKTKVIAYIYRQKSDAKEILVFSHRDFPDAGIQVVGGTVEVGEVDLPLALKREIFEESGLSINQFELKKIGETIYQRQDVPELNHRHYFEITLSNLPDSWSFTVESTGLDNGLVFDFFWLTLSKAKEVLVGKFSEMLP